MKRFIRKVISSSSRSFSLTIPKIKINEWSIKKGDSLLVLDFGKFLKIIPKRKRVKKINVSDIKKIQLFYRNGYDIVEVHNVSDVSKLDLNTILKSLPGSELKLKEDKIIICFSDNSFSRKNLRRIFIIFERLLFFLERKLNNKNFVREEFEIVKDEFVRLFNLAYRKMRYDSKIFMFFLYSFFKYIIFKIEDKDDSEVNISIVRKVYKALFQVVFKKNFNTDYLNDLRVSKNWLFREISLYVDEFNL